MAAIVMTNPATVGVRLAQEPLFSSAHETLTFALHYSMQQYDRPLMNRAMSTKPVGVSERQGLSGLDGAGQAGMIRAQLGKLPPLYQAVLVVSMAPTRLPCECSVSCCSGWKVNPEWQDAMSELNGAAAAGALSGCLSSGRLRSALIQRHFGAKATLSEIAERYEVSQRTVEAHNARLKRWLFGVPKVGDKEAQPGIHEAAYKMLTTILREVGLI